MIKPASYVLVIGLVFAIFCMSSYSISARVKAEEGEKPKLETFFDSPIGDAGQQIVLTRGPYLDPALIKSLCRPSHPELQPSYYEVRAELRSPDGKSVLLAARLRGEDGTTPDKGSVVLDSLIEPGQVVLFVAEGPDLYVWRIFIPGGASWAHFQTDKRWVKAAAAYRLDEKLIGAKLGRTDDGRLTVEVLETLSGYNSHFEEEDKGTLKFKLVRQWK